MNWKVLLIPALALFPAGLASAQTTPPPLLSGTTDDLPWSLYAGGLTDLQTGDNRLRLSAPPQAKVLGTRYDAASRTALLTYRPATETTPQNALGYATDQLQREGFALTYRLIGVPEDTRARALMRRTDRLVEVETIRGATGNVQVLYHFRDSSMPARLLLGEAPDDLQVYAQPIDLKTVQIVPGRIFLTPPGDVLIDTATYRDRKVSLLFYSDFTLSELADFYLPFFRSQGFVDTQDQGGSEQSRTYRLSRSGNTYSLTLTAPDKTSRSTVTLGP